MSTHISDDELDFRPSPARLAESLRDTGYSYEAAFADIVDNSIAANATHVCIDIDTDFNNELKVTIADNGDGMSEATLKDAMRYGSPRRESPKSLGKFGMGLKTASTAFCRRLTVISKSNGRFTKRCWDLDVIIEKNRWELLDPPLKQYADETERLEDIAGDENGTIVVWEKIDRLINQTGTRETRKAIDDLISEIKEHLSAVFGKFLDASNKNAETVRIDVNGEALTGWDPTGMWLNSVEQPHRVSCTPRKVQVDLPTESGVKECYFELNGYILPNRSEMSMEEQNDIRYGNDNQGFYIYRENRLIQGGGWPHRLFTKDPHLNLVRVEVNFDHELDEYFQIDIRKTRFIIPQDLRQKIKQIIAPFRNEANKRYRNGRPDVQQSEAQKKHDNANNAIQKHRDETQNARVVSDDPRSGIFTITNKFGTSEVDRVKLVEGTNVAVDVDNGHESEPLWTFAMNEEGETCVTLNSGHDFYKKFYLHSKNNSTLIQAMDSLFWALANAEIGTYSPTVKRNIEEFRYLVSKDLRALSQELPDVK